MTAPFAPVAFPVFRTRRTPHPASSSSSNPGSSPSDGVPWVKGPVGPLVPPSRSQPCPGPGRLSGSREGAEGSWFLQDGVPKDCWLERPITPTLLGYEIMEERAKFTVYKVLVTGSKGDSWVIFRRYADFSRLNEKLKEIFPRFHLGLPPKRWFKDNYDMEFLEERQIGLQSFLQNLIGHKDIVSSEVVRQFLCLDDPRSPFDSLEESRVWPFLQSFICIRTYSTPLLKAFNLGWTLQFLK